MVYSLTAASREAGLALDTTIGEEALVERARRGELRAFDELVLRYQQLAYNVAYRLLGEAEAAADATQEAFTSAYRNVRGFRGGLFKAWLLRIVTNQCYDVLRSRQRRPSTSLDAMLDDEESPVEFPDKGETPEESVLRHEVAAEIQRGLLTLPVEQRTVVVLFDVQGLSYEEIAEVTRAAMGTVKSRLSRGRAALRDYLTKRGEHSAGPDRRR